MRKFTLPNLEENGLIAGVPSQPQKASALRRSPRPRTLPHPDRRRAAMWPRPPPPSDASHLSHSLALAQTQSRRSALYSCRARAAAPQPRTLLHATASRPQASRHRGRALLRRPTLRISRTRSHLRRRKTVAPRSTAVEPGLRHLNLAPYRTQLPHTLSARAICSPVSCSTLAVRAGLCLMCSRPRSPQSTSHGPAGPLPSATMLPLRVCTLVRATTAPSDSARRSSRAPRTPAARIYVPLPSSRTVRYSPSTRSPLERHISCA